MSLTFQHEKSILTVYVTGDFNHEETDDIQQHLYRQAKEKSVQTIQIDGTKLGIWDSSLVIVLYQLKKIAQTRQIAFVSDTLPDGLNTLLDLALTVNRQPPERLHQKIGFLEKLGDLGLQSVSTLQKGWKFIGVVLHTIWRGLSGQAIMRSGDFWTEIDNAGPKALPIVSLISFMVGLILAFVGAIQLKTFGAQIFVASLVTIGMIRIMGAIMVGIIMAGRTGASYAATIGTMQVNEEIDALKTMGIPVADFLILPRIAGLVIVMPLLVLLADFAGMAGGAFVGVFLLDIPPKEYWKYAWEAFELTNFLVGLFHGIVFGFVISLCGCYYGVFCGRNADSVGVATTKAVVWAIVWMIVLTGLITLMCEVMGI